MSIVPSISSMGSPVNGTEAPFVEVPRAPRVRRVARELLPLRLEMPLTALAHAIPPNRPTRRDLQTDFRETRLMVSDGVIARNDTSTYYLLMFNAASQLELSYNDSLSSVSSAVMHRQLGVLLRNLQTISAPLGWKEPQALERFSCSSYSVQEHLEMMGKMIEAIFQHLDPEHCVLLCDKLNELFFSVQEVLQKEENAYVSVQKKTSAVFADVRSFL